jgi:hypothetical protein
MVDSNSPLFSKLRADPNQEDPSSWAVIILSDLPDPVDPSVVFDRLLDLGFIRSEPGFYDQLVYLTTAKGRRFLEWIEQQPTDHYPDTGESGETYDVETGASCER